MIRTGLGTTAATLAAASPSAASQQTRPENEPFGYCLNTGTIRGQNLSLVEQAEVAAKAGYTGFEPWIRDLRQYVESGGSLRDVKKRIADLGLTVESAIGFAPWMADDVKKRAEGFEQMRRDMELVAAMGGLRIAAPPVGATGKANRDLRQIAGWYRELLELGRRAGVVPQLELWGPSKTLHRLGEVAFVSVEVAHADACVVLDVYHIYKGGSPFAGLEMFNGRRMHVFHINDYPADPPRATITDAHRVYPGDGVAPLGTILRTLRSIGFRGTLSLELFNRDYWKQDALEVARTGLEKTRQAVHKALKTG